MKSSDFVMVLFKSMRLKARFPLGFIPLYFWLGMFSGAPTWAMVGDRDDSFGVDGNIRTTIFHIGVRFGHFCNFANNVSESDT